MARREPIPIARHPIEIRAVRVREVSVKRRPPPDEAEVAGPEPTVETRLRLHNIGRDEDGAGRLFALLDVVADWPSAPSPYVMRFSLEGEFTFGPEISDDVVKLFGQASGITLLWPFAREFAYDLTRRIGVQQLPLPTILPPQPRKRQRSDTAPQ